MTLAADDTAPVIIVVTVTVVIVFADLVDVRWGEWRVSWGNMPGRWCRVMGNWEHVLKVTWREGREDREGKKARGDRRKKGKEGGGREGLLNLAHKLSPVIDSSQHTQPQRPSKDRSGGQSFDRDEI